MSAETGKHQRNRDTRLKEATISEKREDIWENFPENREANSWTSCQVADNPGHWGGGRPPPKWKKSLLAALA
jgi:hypothetical protein